MEGIMSYLQKHVFLQRKQKTNVEVFFMIATKNEAKAMTKQFHVTVNVNSIVQHVFQIKDWITKYVEMNLKMIINAKQIKVEILAHVFAGIASI